MSPLQHAALERRRQQLVEEFLTLLGGALLPSSSTALSTLLEIQAAAGLLSNMGPDDELTFDEQVELIRTVFARIELAILAEEDEEDGVDDDEDAVDLEDEQVASPAA